MKKPSTIIGICGGSCSGKTTLGKNLQLAFGGPARASLLFQDSYYIDQSARFEEDGGEVNFDHPHSLDFELMGRHLQQLKRGQPIDVPIYDFTTHSRKTETMHFEPTPIVLVDGTLILSQRPVREVLDISLFLDVEEALRFERRKKRDVAERGRELKGVEKQFRNHVKPMHDEFVQPSLSFATRVESSFPDPRTLAFLLLCL